ncbi:uncharacterized protein LOC115217882 [Octopus sinensis]|uniref:Uncharacterized protein LOC115217882 n=1 Tax=Octopus sinensis TaxID=2607531 RepID=A0A6P7T0C0_9MOLL|nr:uncharacterized protein LOC115217882 [Octopus sinensis]
MVDTGSSCSILPLRFSSNKPQLSNISLYAVNQSPIKTYGQTSLTLDLALRRNFKWNFVIADLPHTILGADFLHHYSLMVDVRRQRLVDTTTSLSTPACESTAAILSPSFFVTATSYQFHTLLASFPELTDLSFKPTQTVHSTQHFITTTGLPVFSRPSKLAPDRLKKARAAFEHMLSSSVLYAFF